MFLLVQASSPKKCQKMLYKKTGIIAGGMYYSSYNENWTAPIVFGIRIANFLKVETSSNLNSPIKEKEGCQVQVKYSVGDKLVDQISFLHLLLRLWANKNKEIKNYETCNGSFTLIGSNLFFNTYFRLFLSLSHVTGRYNLYPLVPAEGLL